MAQQGYPFQGDMYESTRVFKPHERTPTSTTPRAWWDQIGPNGIPMWRWIFGEGGGMGGSNPWQKRFKETYNQAKNRPYGGEWRQLVANAMSMQGKDYTGDLRRMALEDVDTQYKNFGNQLGQMGMREIALAPDVQKDWTKKRTDATTKAAIEGQGMQLSALEGARSVVAGATGAELDRIQQMIAAASAGGYNYNQYQQLIMPLFEKLGLGSGGF